MDKLYEQVTHGKFSILGVTVLLSFKLEKIEGDASCLNVLVSEHNRGLIFSKRSRLYYSWNY